MLTALLLPRPPIDINPSRCVMPINDAPTLQETRLCGKPAHTHRTIADVVCGLCADCAATLDADTIEDAAAMGLSVRFNSKSIGSEVDFGAYFDRALGKWTAPRYEILDVEDAIVKHRAITREEAVSWLCAYMEFDDAAN